MARSGTDACSGFAKQLLLRIMKGVGAAHTIRSRVLTFACPLHKKALRKIKKARLNVLFFLAEREGFEPSIPFGIRALQARALDQATLSLRNDSVLYTNISFFGN